MIQQSSLKFPIKTIEFYNGVYRGYHRIKYLTEKTSDFGIMGIMISQKTSHLIIHLFINGIYFKFPKYTRYYDKLNILIKEALNKFYHSKIKK